MSGFAGPSTNTRAKAAAAAAAAARHPQAQAAFTEGLTSVFRQWTALELAIFHQWGGPSSAERVDQLVREILELFLGPDKIYKDDVSLVLEDYMETNFNTLCDDGSPDEIGELLCTMWRQCCVGDFTTVHGILGKEFVRHETISKCQGMSSTGDVMDSDDEEDDPATAAVMNAELQTSTLEAIAEGATEDPAEEEEEIMTVDPDGWETVARGKAKPGRKKK